MTRQNFVLVDGHWLSVLRDHEGARSYGEMAKMCPQRLANIDIWLDRYDAANELPDGSLPT